MLFMDSNRVNIKDIENKNDLRVLSSYSISDMEDGIFELSIDEMNERYNSSVKKSFFKSMLSKILNKE